MSELYLRKKCSLVVEVRTKFLIFPELFATASVEKKTVFFSVYRKLLSNRLMRYCHRVDESCIVTEQISQTVNNTKEISGALTAIKEKKKKKKQV